MDPSFLLPSQKPKEKGHVGTASRNFPRFHRHARTLFVYKNNYLWLPYRLLVVSL